jgi:hypothetical protein
MYSVTHAGLITEINDVRMGWACCSGGEAGNDNYGDQYEDERTI